MNVTIISIIIVCISLLISIMTLLSLKNKNGSEVNIKVESLNQLQVYKEIVNSYIDKYFRLWRESVFRDRKFVVSIFTILIKTRVLYSNQKMIRDKGVYSI